MRLFCLLLLFAIALLPAFGQNMVIPLPGTSPVGQQQFLDSVKKFADSLITLYSDASLTNGEKVMSPYYYKKFFTQWLSYVNFAKDGYPDGNSILVAPTASSTRLRTTFAHLANHVVYNVGAEAGFANNIANVLSGKNATTATSFFGSVSWQPGAWTHLNYDVSRGQQLVQEKKVLVERFWLSTQKQYSADYAVDLAAFNLAMVSVAAFQLIRIVNPIGTVNVPVPLLWAYYNARDKLKSYGLNEDASFYGGGWHRIRARALNDSMQNIIDSIEFANDAIEDFRFSWLTGSFAYSRNSYTTYDGNAPFATRINSDPFDSLAFTIGFNHLRQNNAKYDRFYQHESFWSERNRKFRSVYYTLTYNIARDINYAHLKTVNLTTNHNVVGGTDSVVQLQSTAGSGVDITNVPEIDSWLHTFSGRLYLVFKNSNFMGVDLAFSAAYGKLVQPIYTGQLGLMFRFQDSQTKNTKVNFEVFLQLPDFADSQQSGKSTWQRKIVGINAAIPFGKLFF